MPPEKEWKTILEAIRRKYPTTSNLAPNDDQNFVKSHAYPFQSVSKPFFSSEEEEEVVEEQHEQ